MKNLLGVILLIAASLITMTTYAFGLDALPKRDTPVPQTTNGVPHVQIGIDAVPEISEALLHRVAQLPGVSLGATRVSLPGAIGFQLEDGMPLAHPEVIVGGREFAPPRRHRSEGAAPVLDGGGERARGTGPSTATTCCPTLLP